MCRIFLHCNMDSSWLKCRRLAHRLAPQTRKRSSVPECRAKEPRTSLTEAMAGELMDRLVIPGWQLMYPMNWLFTHRAVMADGNIRWLSKNWKMLDFPFDFSRIDSNERMCGNMTDMSLRSSETPRCFNFNGRSIGTWLKIKAMSSLRATSRPSYPV